MAASELTSAGRDLNPRLYGFAGRSLGPLGHRRQRWKWYRHRSTFSHVSANSDTELDDLETFIGPWIIEPFEAHQAQQPNRRPAVDGGPPPLAGVER